MVLLMGNRCVQSAVDTEKAFVTHPTRSRSCHCGLSDKICEKNSYQNVKHLRPVSIGDAEISILRTSNEYPGQE